MKLKIEELIDINELLNKFKSFYAITGVYLKLFDNCGNLLACECSDDNIFQNIDLKDAEKINYKKFILEKFKNGICRITGDLLFNNIVIGSLKSSCFFLKNDKYENKYGIKAVDKDKIISAVDFIVDYIKISVQAEYEKKYDELTGFCNRTYFIKKFNKILNNKHNMGAVLILDFDNLKFVNGTYGYEIGNLVIKESYKRISTCVEDKYIVARKNDQFAILLLNIANKTQVKKLVNKIYEKFKEPIQIDDLRLMMFFGTGIEMFTKNDVKSNEIIKKALDAVIIAKGKGNNNYCFFEEEMYDLIVEKEILMMELKDALADNQFQIYYQPLVDTESNKIYGTEALLRWHHPHKGMLHPSKFIPLAEKNNFIIILGKWVLENACMQCKKWNDMLNYHMIVSVNISQKQIQDAGFIDMVKEALQKTKLNPECLYIEVTESVIMQYPQVCISKLNTLKKMGIKIALDDFGTGYSSLNYLRVLPLDLVKVDKSFIDNIPSNKYEMNIFEGMLQLIKKIKKDIIVEGVENSRQLEFLQKNNCYKIQGFLIGKPQEVQNIESILKDNSLH